MIRGNCCCLLLLSLAVACASPGQPALSEGQLRDSWIRYLRDDPGWPDARELWLLDGARSRAVLVDNLLLELLDSYRSMVRGERAAQRAAAHKRFERAQHELLYVKSDAVPALLELLAVAAGSQPTEWTSVDCLTLTLAELDAATELVAATRATQDPRVQRVYFKVLAQMDDVEVLPVLIGGALQDPRWENRAECVDGLARHVDQDECVQALLRSLRDPDEFVQRRAIQALRPVHRRDVQAGLIDCYQFACERGRGKLADELYDVLRTNTEQLLISRDPRAWREWYQRGSVP